MIEYPKIDNSKLPEVMELIEKAASLMETADYQKDIKAKQKLQNIENKLQILTNKPDLNIWDFNCYWASTDLDTVAKKALFEEPQKRDLTPEEVREIILHMFDQEEAVMDWQLELLMKCLGGWVFDYIFYPESAGLDLNTELEAIIDKIIEDMSSRTLEKPE